MDILDIILGKKAATGNAAPLITQARQALYDAETATTTVNNLVNSATEAQTAAQSAYQQTSAALGQANSAAETYDNLLAVTNSSMIADFEPTIASAINNKTAAIDAQLETALTGRIENVTVEDNNSNIFKKKKLKIRKNNIDTDYDISKNYTATGQNEDGSMTQKAITDALNNQKTLLENKIDNITINNGEGNSHTSINFPDAETGSLVTVGDNGELSSSSITENDIIETQIILGTYIPKNTIGIEVDYDSKTVNRILAAVGLNAGNDFDQFQMYGGRKRCVVNDDGEILAFYGDNNYIEDGSLGQVMVYQPKFYFLRTPLKTTKINNRTLINKENIYISSIKQAGFTVHPAFLDENSNELDYILLPAYEGCAFDVSSNTYNLTDAQTVNFSEDLLSSIANAKPISGASQLFNVTNAEILAQNRGNNWHITTLAAESINQLLMIIEFASFNIQNTFNKGITQLTEQNNQNISCLTGATSNLGSTSGMASSTTQIYGNVNNTFSIEGKNAISYRGVENPYGNIWNFLGDVKIILNNNEQYLTYKDNKRDIKIFASPIPSSSSWISYFGYDKNASWAFIPTDCTGANSALPIGDYTYVGEKNNQDKCCVIGGKGSAQEYAGPFYYGMDYNYDTHTYSYSARIMHKPTYNSDVYLLNIIKWSGGGE